MLKADVLASSGNLSQLRKLSSMSHTLKALC
jgi:hypothetical protein